MKMEFRFARPASSTGASKIAACILLGLLVIFASGCRSDGSLRWGGSPWGQGSVDRQKARAVTFDPYPQGDVGPEVVGGRPRGFVDPLAEPQRNELTSQPPSAVWGGYGR